MNSRVYKIIFFSMFIFLCMPSVVKAVTFDECADKANAPVTPAQIQNAYSNNGNLIFQLNTKKKFDIVIKDITGGKVKIKYSKYDVDENSNAIVSDEQDVLNSYSLNGITAYKLADIEPNSLFILEFLIADKQICGGYTLTSVTINVPSEYDGYKIDITDADRKLFNCATVINKVKEITTKDPTESTVITKSSVTLGGTTKKCYTEDQDDDICDSGKLGYNNYKTGTRTTHVCVSEGKMTRNNDGSAACPGGWLQSGLGRNSNGVAGIGYDFYYQNGTKYLIYNSSDGKNYKSCEEGYQYVQKKIYGATRSFCVKCPANRTAEAKDSNINNSAEKDGFNCYNSTHKGDVDATAVYERTGTTVTRGFCVECYNSNTAKNNTYKALCQNKWNYNSKTGKCEYYLEGTDCYFKDYMKRSFSQSDAEECAKKHLKSITSVSNYELEKDFSYTTPYGENETKPGEGMLVKLKGTVSYDPDCKCPRLVTNRGLKGSQGELASTTGLCEYKTTNYFVQDPIYDSSREKIDNPKEMENYYINKNKLYSDNEKPTGPIVSGGCKYGGSTGEQIDCTFYKAPICTYKTLTSSSTNSAVDEQKRAYAKIIKESAPQCFDKEMIYGDDPNIPDKPDPPDEPDWPSSYGGAGGSICSEKFFAGGLSYDHGTYWNITCRTGYRSSGEAAKLALAGTGFSYETTFVASKHCHITQRKVVKAKQKCKYRRVTLYDREGKAILDKNGNPTTTIQRITSGDCSDNPYKDYLDALNASKNELVRILKENDSNSIKTGAYTYYIQDSYTNSVITINSANDPGINLSKFRDYVNYCKGGETCGSINEELKEDSGFNDKKAEAGTAYSQRDDKIYEDEYECPDGTCVKAYEVGNRNGYTLRVNDGARDNDGNYPDRPMSAAEEKLIKDLENVTVNAFGTQLSLSTSLPIGVTDRQLNSAGIYRDGATPTDSPKIKDLVYNATSNDFKLYYVSWDEKDRQYFTSIKSENTNVVNYNGRYMPYNEACTSTNNMDGCNIIVAADYIDVAKDSEFSSYIKCYYGVYNYTKNPPDGGTPHCQKVDGTYYGKNGNSVSKNTYLKECICTTGISNPNDETCPYCILNKDGYYGTMGFIGGANDSNAKRIYNQQCENTCKGPAVEQVASNMLPWRFRVVDLNELFPSGRTPGFNWTDGAYQAKSNQGLYYEVKPSKTIANIQSKGNKIYDDQEIPYGQSITTDDYQEQINDSKNPEVDYSFILTRTNIQAIREYNRNVADINKDGAKNYLDFDMECDQRWANNANGKIVCQSKFLDNTDYVTYSSGFTSENRKAISVCNNSINHKACDD